MKIMEYKVSYTESWSGEGTHYDQRITAKLSKEELDQFNTSIAEKKRKINEKKIKNNMDVNYLCFARFLLCGKNHTTLTTRELFKSYFKLYGDKRIKDRNTLIVIQLSGT